MLRDEIKQLKSGSRELRKFGWLVGGVLTGLGLLYWARHKAFFPCLLWPGVGLLLLGSVVPRLLKYVYLAWMTLAILLGFVVSHLILTLFFFLVITPVGWVARLAGKDFLRLKLDREALTYWEPRRKRVPSKTDYERQF